jgi:hypothetical protein
MGRERGIGIVGSGDGFSALTMSLSLMLTMAS